MQRNQPIGIFDSGVGGLTVVRKIIKELPAEDIIYLGDTDRFPYGTKSQKQLIRFTGQICDYLIKQNVKLIVIACNSASAAALEWAQEHFDLSIIGVVEPGARAAYLATIKRKVGVIGTQATVDSGAYVKAVRVFDSGLEVFQEACPKFASYVENGRTQGVDIRKAAKEYLKPLKQQNIDSLILGCTHYPLLSGLISDIMGKDVKLISSARETAVEVKEILHRKNLLRQGDEGAISYFSTGPVENFIELGSCFLKQEITNVERITL